MTMAYGFIYFLTNPSMPGITKIGMTLKHPRERMAELSASTSCPERFDLLGFFDTANPREVEAIIHDHFESCRVNGRREFFYAPIEALYEQARTWGDPINGCFVMRELARRIANEINPSEARAAINAALAQARAAARPTFIDPGCIHA